MGSQHLEVGDEPVEPLCQPLQSHFWILTVATGDAVSCFKPSGERQGFSPAVKIHVPHQSTQVQGLTTALAAGPGRQRAGCSGGSPPACVGTGTEELEAFPCGEADSRHVGSSPLEMGSEQHGRRGPWALHEGWGLCAALSTSLTVG